MSMRCMILVVFMQKHFIVLVWLFYHGVPPCYGQTTIHLEPNTLRERCPGEVVTLTCTTMGSPILAWKSDEYIGTGGTQLEFANVNSVGDIVSSPSYPSTVATLTGRRSDSNELTSTLRIRITLLAERSFVTCVNVGTGEMMDTTITLLDEAEALRGVKSVLRREPNNMCAVDLLWDLPSNFDEGDVSHFTVTVNDEEPNVMTQTSTSYTRCFCEPHNVTITLTDRCERTGSSTSVISFGSAQSLFDECDLETTNNTTNNEGSGFNLNNLNVLHLFIALICVSSVAFVLFGILCIIICRCMCRQCCCKHSEKNKNDNPLADPLAKPTPDPLTKQTALTDPLTEPPADPLAATEPPLAATEPPADSPESAQEDEKGISHSMSEQPLIMEHNV